MMIEEGHYWQRKAGGKWEIVELFDCGVDHYDGKLMYRHYNEEDGHPVYTMPDPDTEFQEIITPDQMPTEELENITHLYWVMMSECESLASGDDQPILRHTVEGAFTVWNRSHKTNFEPHWIKHKK